MKPAGFWGCSAPTMINQPSRDRVLMPNHPRKGEGIHRKISRLQVFPWMWQRHLCECQGSITQAAGMHWHIIPVSQRSPLSPPFPTDLQTHQRTAIPRDSTAQGARGGCSGMDPGWKRSWRMSPHAPANPAFPQPREQINVER